MTSRGLPFALVVSLLALPSIAAGEPPKIDRLIPSGIQRGTNASIQIVGKPGPDPLKVWSQGNNPSRDTFEWSFDEKNETAQVTCGEETSPGVHWIRFYNSSGATELMPFFVGTILEATEQEPNNSISDAQVIASESVLVNGLLEKSGEVDTFSVNLPSGCTFVASMQANSVLGSPMDGILQLLDAKGTILAQNDDDQGFDPLIAFPVTTPGLYFVRTFAFPAQPSSSIRFAGGTDYLYRLTLTTEPHVDCCLPMTVSTDEVTPVELFGWNLDESHRHISLNPSDGDSTTIFDGLTNSISLPKVSGESLTEKSSSEVELRVPFHVTGVLNSPEETDSYSVHFDEKRKVTIRVLARELHSPLDPVLSIISSDGKVVHESDDQSREKLDVDTTFDFQPGQYQLSISDRFGAGGNRYFYLLSAEEKIPDFSASIAAEHYVLTNDEELTIPVEIAREEKFAESIQVTVQGLPSEIQPVQETPDDSEEKKEPAKSITLRFKKPEDLDPWSGPIQIICTSESGIVHPATTTIGNERFQSKYLWLTVQ
ncbi:putative subtilase-type serine protease precursor [Thalassoglobus neptunius]|uniref:Putative subtilase-type serine protease n=1 Tax=Thalassoglobus neptunius TaxID=1938619 RepID=A0A5C5X7W4_9PLAN|nr:PPC domain-containing protein [Thalassoglobus neptunius]TWT59146.1 putative subtilase-type serine protease precursor [Thalassoglobus neptunius]